MRNAITAIVILLAFAVSADGQETPKFVYFFGPESTAVQMDSSTYEMSDIRNLCTRMGLIGAYQTTPDSSGTRLYALTGTPPGQGSLPDASGRTQVAVLWADQQGGLGLRQRVDLPTPLLPEARGLHDDIVSLATSPDGNSFFVSWHGPHNELVTGIFDAKSYKRTKEIPGIGMGTQSCISSDGKSLINEFAGQLNMFSLPDYVSMGPFDWRDKVGHKSAFFKKIVSMAGCSLAVVETQKNKKSGSTSSQVYIYDLRSEKNLYDMPLQPTFGDYALVPERGLLLFDESGLVESRSHFGGPAKRMIKLGKLHIYNLRSREEKILEKLPRESIQLQIAPDHNRVFYLTPKKTSVIDLSSGSVLKTLDIPFVKAAIVFIHAE